MRIAIVTDAWTPQINGVVRTYQNTRHELTALGHRVEMVTPEQFVTLPCPTYPDIALAAWPWSGVSAQLEAFQPDAVHVATEGPLGHAARRWCRRHSRRFTTCFHTQFPEYVGARVPIPVNWTYRYLRRFHARAERTMVPTRSQRERLQERGFRNLGIWGRGVDTELFRPRGDRVLDLPRPIAIYMGRVAVEKNIDAFLELDLSGSKVVIGDGPAREGLMTRHPDVHFLGALHGEALAEHLACGDVFVFPSLTDTFGVVLLEALACGVPVAAFPTTGPIDVLEQGRTGVMDWNLRDAVNGALDLDRDECVNAAQGRSWRAATGEFLELLAA